MFGKWTVLEFYYVQPQSGFDVGVPYVYQGYTEIVIATGRGRLKRKRFKGIELSKAQVAAVAELRNWALPDWWDN